MPIGLWYMVTFVIGALVGRYFEGILKAFRTFRRDFRKLQREAAKSVGG